LLLPSFFNVPNVATDQFCATPPALEEVFLKITRQANAEESRLVLDPWGKVSQIMSSSSQQTEEEALN